MFDAVKCYPEEYPPAASKERQIQCFMLSYHIIGSPTNMISRQSRRFFDWRIPSTYFSNLLDLHRHHDSHTYYDMVCNKQPYFLYSWLTFFTVKYTENDRVADPGCSEIDGQAPLFGRCWCNGQPMTITRYGEEWAFKFSRSLHHTLMNIEYIESWDDFKTMRQELVDPVMA